MSDLKQVQKYIKLKNIVDDLCPDLPYNGGVASHINGKSTKGGEPHPGLTEKEKASLKPAFNQVADMLKSEADKM